MEKSRTIKEKQNDIVNKILVDCKIDIDSLFEKYKTSYEGISVVEVDDRIEEYGKNIVEIKNNNTIFHKIKEAFINPFNIVLTIVAIITFITDVVIASKKDYSTFILILSTILISAIISLKEQTKSDNAAKKLKKMITNKMEVIRDDVQTIVDIENI